MDISKVIGTFGDKLKIMAKALLENEKLCKVLYYSDDPLGQPNVENKMETILNKHIIVNTEVPYDSKKGSYILLTINNIDRNSTNNEIVDVELYVDIITPTSDWNYRGPSLRPFFIMEQVTKAFKTIDLQGVGKFQFGGATLAVTANSMSGYTLRFVNYDLGV